MLYYIFTLCTKLSRVTILNEKNNTAAILKKNIQYHCSCDSWTLSVTTELGHLGTINN